MTSANNRFGHQHDNETDVFVINRELNVVGTQLGTLDTNVDSVIEQSQDGTSYVAGTSNVLVIGGHRNDDYNSLTTFNNSYAPLQLNRNGAMRVEDDNHNLYHRNGAVLSNLTGYVSHNIKFFRNEITTGYTAWMSDWADGLRFVLHGGDALRKLSSSSANDTSAGTGAREVLIEGWKANGVFTTELLATTGQADGNTTTETYDYVSRVSITKGGSNLSNEGVMYISNDGSALTGGVPNSTVNILNIMGVGQGITDMPAVFIGGYERLYPVRLVICSNSDDTVEVRIFLSINNGEDYERIIGTWICPASGTVGIDLRHLDRVDNETESLLRFEVKDNGTSSAHLITGSFYYMTYNIST